MDNNNDLSAIRSGERGTDTLRHLGLSLVTPMNTLLMSDEDTELLWQFVKTQEYMFSDFERGNREGFIMRLRDMRHLHLDIGGDGYCILLNAWCCDTPELHFCLWNPRRPFQQTLTAGQEILNFVFKEMKATRLGGFIPENNKLASKFATILGFKYEGCIRQGFRFFDRSYDVNVYGLLRNEWQQRQERLKGASHGSV